VNPTLNVDGGPLSGLDCTEPVNVLSGGKVGEKAALGKRECRSGGFFAGSLEVEAEKWEPLVTNHYVGWGVGD